MLKTMRKRNKFLIAFLWLLILTFLGTIVVVWGVGGNQKQANVAITVNGETIGFDVFNEEYTRVYKFYKDEGFEDLDERELKNIVSRNMIEVAVLTQSAEDMGVVVSDAEVLNAVQSQPVFFGDSQTFDPEKYREILGQVGYSPSYYESKIRDSITLEKIGKMLEDSIEVTDEEIELELEYRNKTITLSTIDVNMGRYREMVTYSDEELETYFEMSGERYREPAAVKFKYALFSPEEFLKKSDTTDKELLTYYEENLEEFRSEETVTASHILFLVNDFEDEEDVKTARNKAELVLAFAKAGQDFGELAEKYSEGPTAPLKGYLGEFGRGQMVKPFEDAAFDLEVGELSDIVETTFGFHIIKVSEHKEAEFRKFEDAREDIAARVLQEKGVGTFENYVYDSYNEILKELNISLYDEKSPGELSIFETDFVKQGFQSALGDTADLLAPSIPDLFLLEVGDISQVYDLPGGDKVVFEVSEIRASYIPDFEEIKEEVLADYIFGEAIPLARTEIMELIENNSLEEIAAQGYAAEVGTYGPIQRGRYLGPDMVTASILDSLFKSPVGENFKEVKISPDGNSITAYRVDKLEDGVLSEDERESAIAEVRQHLWNVKRGAIYTSYLEGLMNKADIWYNPALL